MAKASEQPNVKRHAQTPVGQSDVGHLNPVGVVASNDHNAPTMLLRWRVENVDALLRRLDVRVALALAEGEHAGGINRLLWTIIRPAQWGGLLRLQMPRQPAECPATNCQQFLQPRDPLSGYLRGGF